MRIAPTGDMDRMTIPTEQEKIIACTGQNERIFARNHNRDPIPLARQPVLIRAFYLSANEDLEQRLPSVLPSLSSPTPDTLLKLLSSPDGPPNRMARIFKFRGSQRLSVLQGDRLSPKVEAKIYREARKENYAWDKEDGGAYGVFVSGNGDPTCIWRVSRIDRDVFDAPLITMFPLATGVGFPRLDLSTVENSLIRAEIEGHYQELQQAFRTNAYRALITHAKNVAEALVPLKAGLKSRKSFAENLDKIGDRLGEPDSISDLAFRLGGIYFPVRYGNQCRLLIFSTNELSVIIMHVDSIQVSDLANAAKY